MWEPPLFDPLYILSLFHPVYHFTTILAVFRLAAHNSSIIFHAKSLRMLTRVKERDQAGGNWAHSWTGRGSKHNAAQLLVSSIALIFLFFNEEDNILHATV